MTGQQQATSVGQLTGRGTAARHDRIRKNQHHFYIEMGVCVGGALGWALLIHSSQKGQLARRVDQGCPGSQKARLSAPSSGGRPGKAPREAGFRAITGWAVSSRL